MAHDQAKDSAFQRDTKSQRSLDCAADGGERGRMHPRTGSLLVDHGIAALISKAGPPPTLVSGARMLLGQTAAVP